jgi:GNAT superfamily N-acetyltransferase
MADTELHEAPFSSAAVARLIAEWNEELVATVPGFSPDGGSLVTDDDFVRPRGAFLVATAGPQALGCGGVRRLSETVGEVKRLFVRRPARGSGVGRTLLAGIEAVAGELGVVELRLDTMGREAAALALFRSTGWEEIPDYNGNERARHWFAKRLIGDASRD